MRERFMSKTILNYHDRSDRVQSLTKTKHDNDVTNHTSVVYIFTILDYHDWSDRVLTWWKPGRTTTWLIIQKWSTSKMKLSCRDQSDRVWFVMKTRQDNDVTNRIGLVYVKTKPQFSGPIWSGAVYDENQIRQWRDWYYRCGLRRKRYLTIAIAQIAEWL